MNKNKARVTSNSRNETQLSCRHILYIYIYATAAGHAGLRDRERQWRSQADNADNGRPHYCARLTPRSAPERPGAGKGNTPAPAPTPTPTRLASCWL